MNQNLIPGLSAPFGVAVDGTLHLLGNACYGTIGRANLDGTGVNQSFITGSGSLRPSRSTGRTSTGRNRDLNRIGRANLDGTGVNTDFITGINSPGGVAVDATHIYWGNDSTNTIAPREPRRHGREPELHHRRLPSHAASRSTGTYIYWANGGTARSAARTSTARG